MLIEMALNNHLSQELSLSLSAPPAAADVLECISLVSSITELILLHYRTRLTFPFLPMPGRIGQMELKDRWDISEDKGIEELNPIGFTSKHPAPAVRDPLCTSKGSLLMFSTQIRLPGIRKNQDLPFSKRWVCFSTLGASFPSAQLPGSRTGQCKALC